MRLAVVGKGGAGKSVITGTLARILARRGHHVLALDMDTLPGLRFSLGLSMKKNGDAGLPENLAERKPKKGWVLKKGVTVNELVKKYSIEGPDGLRFLQLGKLPDKVKPTSNAAFWHVLTSFKAKGWDVLTDLAAGTRQPFFGWSNFADTIVIIVEPSAKSLLTGRRLAKLAKRPESHDKRRKVVQPQVMFVANKLQVGDLTYLRRELKECKIPIVAEIPYDKQLAAAEQSGTALIDSNTDAPAMIAMNQLADQLLELTRDRAKHNNRKRPA